ncbi:MAG: methylmalonyl-CoA epimerase, partial [Armatimonadota bacterium]
ALQVDDIHAAIRTLKDRGVALQDDEPRPGAANTLIVFLKQGAAGGLLVELTQPVKDSGTEPR